MAPCAPVGPWAPVAPVGPCGPGSPVGACGPGSPVGPCGPGSPVRPCGPVSPVGPASPTSCGLTAVSLFLHVSRTITAPEAFFLQRTNAPASRGAVAQPTVTMTAASTTARTLILTGSFVVPWETPAPGPSRHEEIPTHEGLLALRPSEAGTLVRGRGPRGEARTAPAAAAVIYGAALRGPPVAHRRTVTRSPSDARTPPAPRCPAGLGPAELPSPRARLSYRHRFPSGYVCGMMCGCGITADNHPAAPPAAPPGGREMVVRTETRPFLLTRKRRRYGAL